MTQTRGISASGQMLAPSLFSVSWPDAEPNGSKFVLRGKKKRKEKSRERERRKTNDLKFDGLSFKFNGPNLEVDTNGGNVRLSVRVVCEPEQ